MSDPVIVDAENTLILYQRYLREIPTATVPRHWAEALVTTLEVVLDKHAELAIAFEAPDFDEELSSLADDDGWPPDELEAYDIPDEE